MVRTERLALVPPPPPARFPPTRNPKLGQTLKGRREAVLSLKGRNDTSPPASFFFFFFFFCLHWVWVAMHKLLLLQSVGSRAHRFSSCSVQAL